MTHTAARKTTQATKPVRISLAPARQKRDFVLRVDGHWAVVVDAPTIEDAMLIAECGDWPHQLDASLVEVGDPDNWVDFVVGR